LPPSSAPTADKSSLIRAIADIERPRGGRIVFAERDITGLDSYEICNLGIGQVAEGRQLFPTLTVTENLATGATLARARVKMKQTMESVFELFPRRAKKQLAGTLSGGGRPELIMFDEPSLVLAPTIVRQLLHAVRLLESKGSDDVINRTKRRSLTEDFTARLRARKRPIVMSGSGKELLSNESVRLAYLGL